MPIIDTFKDFFGGLTRGFGLFLNERNNVAEHAITPRDVLK